MKTAVWTGKKKIEIMDKDMPLVGTGDVLIRIDSVGLCGTDLHIYEGHPIGTFYPSPPLILGHEASGFVFRVGSEVSDLKENDRVVIEPEIGCGYCDDCKAGRYYACSGLSVCGFNRDGAYAEYISVPRRAVHVIPEGTDMEEAALTDILAGPVFALSRLRIDPSYTVLILGPGAAGLCFVQVVKLSGPRKIILTGTRETKLKLGEKLGADVIIHSKQQDVLKTVLAETDGKGADIVIEAAGVADTVRQAIELVKNSGTILFFGIPIAPVDGVDFASIVTKDVSLLSCCATSPGHSASLRLMAEGRVTLKPLITHHCNLEEIEKGFALMKERRDEVIRIILKPCRR